MTIHVHDLTGCAPVPLASYLSGLGILRLVGEQADPQARGWWEHDAFRLATALDPEELTTFFLERYAPTPIIAPWNGGSGFYPGDQQDGIAAIESDDSPRLASYRDAIEAGRALVGDADQRPSDDAKTTLIARLRRALSPTACAWLDACVVLADGAKPGYPSLLGTGGNDGRFDFTNNFMQRVAYLLLDEEGRRRSPHLFEAAVRDRSTHDLLAASAGQADPTTAGGENMASTSVKARRVNPWTFVLMLEGAVVFAGAVSRRLAAGRLPKAAAPFAVHANPVGYASAAEESAGRGEQWMPLWRRPATATEVTGMIAEGRAQVGRRGVEDPVDFGRAVARLGVARGIDEFVRYGYIERNGRANLAIPLSRWQVRPAAGQRLLDEIAGWLEGLRRAGRHERAPAAFARTVRAVDSAVLLTCRRPGLPGSWQELLRALARAEERMIRTPRFTAEQRLAPLPRLSAEWARRADDGSPEFALARAVATQRIAGHRSIRCLLVPLAEGGGRPRFEVASDRIRSGPDQLPADADLVATLRHIVRRARLEAEAPSSGFPLHGRCGVDEATVGALLRGELDEARVRDLVRATAAIRTDEDAADDRPHASQTQEAPGLPAAWELIRLAAMPTAIADGLRVPTVRDDPAVTALLASGRVHDAAAAARRRLVAAGIIPHVRVAVGESHDGPRLAASLAVPLGFTDWRRLVRRSTRPVDDVAADAAADASITP